MTRYFNPHTKAWETREEMGERPTWPNHTILSAGKFPFITLLGSNSEPEPIKVPLFKALWIWVLRLFHGKRSSLAMIRSGKVTQLEPEILDYEDDED